MILNLLFTKDGLQYQIAERKKISDVFSFFKEEGAPESYILDELNKILASKKFSEIRIVTALNQFAITSDGFTKHHMGYDLIALNANTDQRKEELMLTVNKNHHLQFYFTFPTKYYNSIKKTDVINSYNFSGEEFLSKISIKTGKEIHINLYHHQCEFFVFKNKKLLLYNNLDVNSEVDFLYFIMFTLSKINFEIDDTSFYLYGETKENETFISELKKFVNQVFVVSENRKNSIFIMKP